MIEVSHISNFFCWAPGLGRRYFVSFALPTIIVYFTNIIPVYIISCRLEYDHLRGSFVPVDIKQQSFLQKENSQTNKQYIYEKKNSIFSIILNNFQQKTYKIMPRIAMKLITCVHLLRLSESDIFHSDGTLKILPTFSEFISYLVTISPQKYDPHFIPVSVQCAVCHIDYNTVLLTETFSEDLEYMMK